MIQYGKEYKHFKGGIYKPLFNATHSETEETLIVYQNVETMQIWARPINMWEEIVDEKATSRFTLIDKDN